MGLRDKYAYAIQTAKGLRMQGAAEEKEKNGQQNQACFSFGEFYFH